ncbi:Reverse transcriptase domain [Trinorchestia longiramus]|nr:Reverse transcriptase domain [Trinorchestia longiramus]
MKKHYEDVSPFLSVLEIGAWRVKCHLPANQVTSVGAIEPFGEDTSREELTEALIDAGFGGVTMERIYKAFLQPIASISTEQDLGSDHYSIVTCIGVEPSSVRYKSHPSWRFGSGKWEDWSAALQQPEMPEILDVEQDSDSKANALADHFEKTLGSSPPTPFPQFVLLPLALALNSSVQSLLNEPFTTGELDRSLASLRNAAPGLDRLTSIIPIPKPFKPLTAVESFRSISLLSCLLKLVERMIAQRLTFYLEQNGAFRNSQGGFRQFLAALDQVARLEAAVRSVIARREILLCLFVDLTDAFNTVQSTGVPYKLGSCGVRGPSLQWLHSYLTNRSFQVYFEGSHSSVRRARSGVPQGGILSPMLFNLMMSDIPIQTEVQSREYADDLTFFTAHKDLHLATDKLQTQMDSLNKLSQEWGLKIDARKTRTMCFTNKRPVHTPIPSILPSRPHTEPRHTPSPFTHPARPHSQPIHIPSPSPLPARPHTQPVHTPSPSNHPAGIPSLKMFTLH